MIQTPLHHCYVISANSTSVCLKAVVDHINNLFIDSDTDPIFDTDIIETLTIDMARQLRSRGQYKTTGEIRCIMRGFDTATIEAQNALLKIIESPADGTHFFFITPEPSHLLETVRSRSHILTDVCSQDTDVDVAKLVDNFLSASVLAERLDIVGKIETRDQLRIFIKQLAQTDLPKQKADFGEAVELAADYSRDVGASVKLLGQLLAVTASGSPEEE